MQCHTQLHYSEAGPEMPAMNAHTIHYELAQFTANLLQLVFTKFLKIVRAIDLAQQWSCTYFFHSRHE
jgi:hypothetical protein